MNAGLGSVDDHLAALESTADALGLREGCPRPRGFRRESVDHPEG
ncbi:hypothetical protein ABGB18_28520 [Nonomuraea sp. B12E4]